MIILFWKRKKLIIFEKMLILRVLLRETWNFFMLQWIVVLGIIKKKKKRILTHCLMVWCRRETPQRCCFSLSRLGWVVAFFATTLADGKNGTEKILKKIRSRFKQESSFKKACDGCFRLMEFVNQNPNVSSGELAESLNLSRRTVATYLKYLVEAELLKRVGPDNCGYWEVLGDGN